MSEDSLLFLNPKSDKLQILYLRDDFTCGNIPIADAIIGAHTEIVVSGCIDFKSKKVIVDEDDDNTDIDSGIVSDVLFMKKPIEGLSGKFLKNKNTQITN